MATHAEFYVYLLLREDGATPFYVGKGKADRWNDHERQAHKKATYKNHVIRQIVAAIGHVPKIKIAEGLTQNEAVLLEVSTIAEYGRHPEGLLTNRTRGGEGCVDPSPEVRKAMGAANVGRKMTDQQRADLSKRLTGIAKSEQHRRNIAAGKLGNQYTKGRKQPPEEIERRKASRLAGAGYVVTPEHATKSVATRRANGNMGWSAESRAKLSATITGRRTSEETKAKQRAAALARYAN